ncbi:hypothetical protein ABH922_000517 [Rhodococcus sp. 27YEA15]
MPLPRMTKPTDEVAVSAALLFAGHFRRPSSGPDIGDDAKRSGHDRDRDRQ